MEVNEIDLVEWEHALPSSGYEAFHDPDVLRVLDKHTEGSLRLYRGSKGGQSIALFPLFVRDWGVGRMVLSPPTALSIPRLGPIVTPVSPKRRKYEQINQDFTTHVVDTLDLDNRTTLFHMIGPLEYDPRPFGWNGFNLDPQFTYVVDLEDTDLETVLGRFSKSLRNEMRRYDEIDLSIDREGIDAALRIYQDTVDQYDRYNESAPMSEQFVRDLLTELDDDRWRAYVARRPDGEYESGILVLFSNELAYYWQGGVAASYENVSVNNLIHRVILEDLLDDPALETVTGYDLVGANNERLCDYKGKFDGELRSYYVVESSGLPMSLAKSAYSVLESPSKALIPSRNEETQ